jgi:hypothetical protein
MSIALLKQYNMLNGLSLVMCISGVRMYVV